MWFMESGLWKTKKLGMMVGDTQTYLFYADLCFYAFVCFCLWFQVFTSAQALAKHILYLYDKDCHSQWYKTCPPIQICWHGDYTDENRRAFMNDGDLVLRKRIMPYDNVATFTRLVRSCSKAGKDRANALSLSSPSLCSTQQQLAQLRTKEDGQSWGPSSASSGVWYASALATRSSCWGELMPAYQLLEYQTCKEWGRLTFIL